MHLSAVNLFFIARCECISSWTAGAQYFFTAEISNVRREFFWRIVCRTARWCFSKPSRAGKFAFSTCITPAVRIRLKIPKKKGKKKCAALAEDCCEVGGEKKSQYHTKACARMLLATRDPRISCIAFKYGAISTVLLPCKDWATRAIVRGFSVVKHRVVPFKALSKFALQQKPFNCNAQKKKN